MVHLNVVWTERALAQLQEIGAYIALDGRAWLVLDDTVLAWSADTYAEGPGGAGVASGRAGAGPAASAVAAIGSPAVTRGDGAAAIAGAQLGEDCDDP